jgi:hypothetical protein
MSVDTVRATPRPPTSTHGGSSWTQMETRLVAAQVGDLLDRAAVRLTGLARLDGLAADTLDEVSDVLAALELNRRQVARIRRGLPPEGAPLSTQPDRGTDQRSVVPPAGAGST